MRLSQRLPQLCESGYLARCKAVMETHQGFELEFQRRTRRRYGALALFADLSLVFLVMSLLILPFFVARRARDRRKLRALLAADAAAEQAERESMLAMLLALGLGPDQTGGRTSAEPVPPESQSPHEGDNTT